MKFQMTVRNVGEDETWEEDYNHPTVNNQEQAEKAAARMIELFNATLQPKEKAREVVYVTFGEGASKEPHQWEKTNSFTISGRGGASYDTARCKGCGITSKRYGVADNYRLDPQFRAIAFQMCDTARQLLAKRAATKEKAQ